MNPESEDSELIDKLGGSGAVARLCGVTSQAVSVWRRKGIPDLRRRLLMLEHADLVRQVAGHQVEHHAGAAVDSQVCS
jgi:hypothetical protein